jgi:hypothetical protein
MIIFFFCWWSDVPASAGADDDAIAGGWCRWSDVDAPADDVVQLYYNHTIIIMQWLVLYIHSVLQL